MSSERKTIYLCLAHISEAGLEQKYVEESLFKVGFCLPAGPYITDDDVRYIVDSIKEAIVRK